MGNYESGSVTYEKRVVAFVDILGFQKDIDKTIRKDGFPNKKKIREIDDAIREMAKLMEPETKSLRFLRGTKIFPSAVSTRFSDCIVGSIQFKDPAEVFRWLISLHWIPIELMRTAGLTCRGGVAFGYAHHTESVLFGPAINRAYHLEHDDDKAINPRIVIDPEVLSMLEGARTEIRESEKMELEDIVVRDEDDWYYINYFRRPQLTSDDGKWDEYRKRRDKVVRKHLQCSDPRIRDKYKWMQTKIRQANLLIATAN